MQEDQQQLNSMLLHDLSDRRRRKPTRQMPNHTNGENPPMEDYDKTESMEERDRSGIENSKDFGKDPTPPPMK